MLKLIYDEMGLELEYLADSLEMWMAARSILALRTGQGVWMAPGRAAIALPDWEPWRSQLAITLAHSGPDNEIAGIPADHANTDRTNADHANAGLANANLANADLVNAVTIEPVDQGWVEVSGTGVWVASGPTAETGMMAVMWGDRLEGILAQWWQASREPAPRLAQKCLPLE